MNGEKTKETEIEKGMIPTEEPVAEGERLEEKAVGADLGEVQEKEAAKAEKPRFTLCGIEPAYLLLMSIVFAFIGWVGENAAIFVNRGEIDCRFHFLPFIPVYGLVPIAIHLLFGNTNDLSPFGRKLFKKRGKGTVVLSNVLALVIIFAAVFLGELAVGNLWEALTGVSLWNYAEQPFHVTKYAGLIPMLGYGGAAYLLSKLIIEPGLPFLKKKVPYRVALIIVCVLGGLLLLDDAIMCVYLFVFREKPVWWLIKLF